MRDQCDHSLWVESEAAEVPRAKRDQIVDLMKAGHTIGETRKEVDLPLMVVALIVIQECESKAGGLYGISDQGQSGVKAV